MLETYQKTIPEMQIEEIKSIKYQNALKVIEEALVNWAYDSMNDISFTYFVDGVIQATKDWSDNE